MPTFIDGIGASENIDSSGERISIIGMDISSLAVDGVFNYEHELAKDKDGNPIQIKIPALTVGKVLKAKKIFSEQDCEDDRQTYFWEKCQVPFVYIMGELFDDYKDSAKDVAGMFMYDMDRKGQNERNVMNFSIEGSTIDKDGIDVVRSIARKVTIAVHPANKMAIAEIVPADNSKQKDDLDGLFKTETVVEIELLKSENVGKYLDQLKKSSPDLKVAAPADSKGTHLGKTNSGKSVYSHERIHNYKGFSSKDHRDAMNIHHNAIKSGRIKENQHHMNKMKLHMQAASSAERREGRYAVGKQKAAEASLAQGKQVAKIPGFGGMAKSMTAGSGMAAPGQLVGGAATTPQSLDKKLHKSEFWLKRAEEEYSNWDKKDQFVEFMSKRMPNMTKSEIDAFGATLALKKSLDSEKSLESLLPEEFKKKDK